MTALEKSAKNDTVGMILTLILYAVGAVSAPYVKVAEWLGGGPELEWYLAFAFKTICSILPVYLMFQFGFKKAVTGSGGGIKGFLLCVPAFLVALDNFPFLPLITGSLKFVGSAGDIFPYVLYCLSIGVMEETIFRGNVLPLFMFKFSKDKKGTLCAVVVSSAKAFAMMENYFGKEIAKNRLEVKDGEKLDLVGRSLTFVAAPMVHWPEVMVAYDDKDKILFSADAFGKFGDLDSDEPWDDEARRYYIGIVGKYGTQAQSLLKKAAALDIAKICPLHGEVLDKDLAHYVSLYNIWSSYAVESEGALICYTSVYGHTKIAAELLAEELEANGEKVAIYDLARTDESLALAEAFRYGKLVLATTTYNGEAFPAMREFINELIGHNYQNRKVGFIENGSWAPVAKKKMTDMLSVCKGLHMCLYG